MKARIYANQMRSGAAARDFIRLARSASSRPTKGMDESHSREAQEILESIREQEDSRYELDIDITGKNLIGQMNSHFDDLGLVPYFFSNAALASGEAISVGSRVSIPADDRRFRVVSISRRDGAVRIRDAKGNEYLVPWQLVQPWGE
jgi:hypothetical protein